MRRIVHNFSCLLLALILTGPGFSDPAKGAMLVELCANGSAQQIWLDADGNPVQPGKTHAKCLNCLLFSAILPDATTVALALDPLRVPEGTVLPGARKTTPVAYLCHIPRGPPAASINGWRIGDPRPVVRSLHLSNPALLDGYQAAAKASIMTFGRIYESARA